MDNDQKSKLILLLQEEAERLGREGIRINENSGSLHGIAEITARRSLLSVIECLKKL